jgi:non-specific serine/threonine protein kinase/serine/threonine-protein kinase
MTPEEWQRVKIVAADVWSLPLADRDAHAAAACAGDEALYREVRSLVQSMDQAGDRFEVPALAMPGADAALRDGLGVASTSPLEGDRIGPWRILHGIGEGGMGTVYLAERVDAGFEQRAAIKLVRGGFADEFLIQRFREERRILATLDHPCIARLVDGGTTERGLPYVAMEYVEGVPIDEYCEKGSLSIRPRLELFRMVCGAVQYAHGRLVIHRDIKATNILVAPDGTPKLLDFGIAKLIEPGFDATAAPRTVMRMVTPETASPEQLLGEPVSTAADVYGLGVLLYRLITGRSPYHLQSHTETALVKAVCEQIPELPSVILRRAGVVPVFDADLDRIVMKALRKEPERRYGTVEKFADDVRRYLGGLPIHAAPESVTYRARKFVGRHRMAVAAAAVAAVAVVAAVTAIVWQTRIAQGERARAEQRFADVRQLVNGFMFEVHDAMQILPGSTPARKLLITKVLEYLDTLSRDLNGEPLLEREVATAYRKVGDVQGNPYSANVGDKQGAVASYRKALAINLHLVAVQPTTVNRSELAMTYSRLGDMLWARGDNAGALEQYQAARDIRGRLSEENPTSAALKQDLAASYYSLGQSYLRVHNDADAATSYAAARALQQQVVEADPANAQARRDLAVSIAKLGDVARVRGDVATALAHDARSVTILKELTATQPGNAPWRRTLSFALMRLADDEREAGQFANALAHSGEALAASQELARLDPTNAQARGDVPYAHRLVGESLAGLKRFDEALTHLDRAAETLTSLLAVNPGEAEDVRELALALRSRGDVLIESDAAAALASYRRAIALIESPPLRTEKSRDVVVLYEHAGDAARSTAGQPSSSPAQRQALENAACGHYKRGLTAVRALDDAPASRSAVILARLESKLAGC